jgi:hypothetical protein
MQRNVTAYPIAVNVLSYMYRFKKNNRKSNTSSLNDKTTRERSGWRGPNRLNVTLYEHFLPYIIELF